MLITDVLFGTATTVVTSVAVFAMFLLLWYLLPLRPALREAVGEEDQVVLLLHSGR